MDHGELRLPAAADDSHHPLAEREARAPGPSAATSPASSSPGCPAGSRAAPGSAAPLVHVGAVEARGAHRDEHLARTRERVGMLARHELAGDQRDRLHRVSTATHSTCGVWGNMSSGVTRSSRQPASTSCAAFGASVVGLQET